MKGEGREPEAFSGYELIDVVLKANREYAELNDYRAKETKYRWAQSRGQPNKYSVNFAVFPKIHSHIQLLITQNRPNQITPNPHAAFVH